MSKDTKITEQQVIGWAEEKGIFDKADVKSQLLKTYEELGEVTNCVLKNKSVEETMLELGDVYVTLILVADMLGTSMSDALDAAYHKIKNRKGRMVDGVFVKEGDE